jgi:hypothetical protein
VRATGSPREVAAKVDAATLIVSGQDARNLTELLQSQLVLAANPDGADVRLVVAPEARTEVEALIAGHGYLSTPASLTLEEAALVIAHRAGIVT